MKISRRMSLVPSSPIRKLATFANKAKAEGVEVLHLNIGQPDLPTPELFFTKLSEISKNLKQVAYADSNGVTILREELQKYYTKKYSSVLSEDILITHGASEALLFAFMAVTDPEDEILVPEPFYANYKSIALQLGINIVPIRLNIENDFLLPEISEIESLISSKTKAILICNPDNPTGKVYSKTEMGMLAQIVSKHNLWLISDEVYREFCYDDIIHHSVLEIDTISDRVIMIDSLSKRYSLCGSRVGCIVSKNTTLMTEILKLAQTRLAAPTIEQVAAAAIINTSDEYLDTVKLEYSNRRNTLIKALQNIPGLQVSTAAQGAFYVIAALPVEDVEHFCQWLLSDFSHKNTTLMLAPAGGFYSDAERGKQQVRIAYVLREEDLLRACEVLEVALRNYELRVM